MGNKTIAGIIAGIVVVSYQMATGAFTRFIVAGIIPGTAHALPAWAMFGLCCLAITWIVTLFVEDFIVTLRRRASLNQPKQRLPKRRYTTL